MAEPKPPVTESKPATPAQRTEGLKEAQLQIAKTLTEMKAWIRHQPRDMWDGRKPKKTKVRWTKKKDSMLLLAVAKTKDEDNGPDWENLSDMVGRDRYPPDELEDRFYYMAYKSAMGRLSQTAAALRAEEATREEETTAEEEPEKIVWP
ncbi:hypothetical protein PHISCL_07735 [Aspergillus sclerotialis]|uniref:Uncharacterized protein n=1 Tax=Aspergillus sclerotialis TaxID=2070753 RepID=A0A3A2Z9Z9_9EURO|nr:hypothetical protein PHISCL_07735 [Aspergillus sclerotialis]